MLERKSKSLETVPEAADVLLQHVLAVCPAIIYTTQASGDFQCTFVSENIEQILGYTQREMRDDLALRLSPSRQYESRLGRQAVGWRRPTRPRRQSSGLVKARCQRSCG